MNKKCICEDHYDVDEFTDEQWAKVDKIIDKYCGKPGALIPVLEEVQAVTGFLPEVVQRRVATGLNIPLAQVYGVVTFYSFFTMKPRGRNQIRICLGTACHVRGAQQNMDALEQRLHIKQGECTADREFSIDVVRCLGACGLAPVMTINDDTHRQVKAVKIDEILREYQPENDSSKEHYDVCKN
ncbi:MAG TPA: NADH-quinone oxidoreductase subunit NuoE [Spirochaetota bacterium]|nr:NADH-quinone oxidoreductase subunit NuoE [Spirochaetota bacterium]HPI90637.1 NADH-quinone oxidoreductase subunit NuoE [Spirochaetota bacterium]HPR49179.1 NADH-quinone oxidoreductase subunit NuoE [Spirochaetota bacterium]